MMINTFVGVKKIDVCENAKFTCHINALPCESLRSEIEFEVKFASKVEASSLAC